MAIPQIPYQFHDALLEDFDLGPRQEVTLRISLYSIFYPGSPVVWVRFGAITNYDSVRNYFGKIEKPETEEGLTRIDALQYDTKRQSTENKLYFYLLLDWEGALNIHCSKFSVSDLETRAV